MLSVAPLRGRLVDRRGFLIVRNRIPTPSVAAGILRRLHSEACRSRRSPDGRAPTPLSAFIWRRRVSGRRHCLWAPASASMSSQTWARRIETQIAVVPVKRRNRPHFLLRRHRQRFSSWGCSRRWRPKDLLHRCALHSCGVVTPPHLRDPSGTHDWLAADKAASPTLPAVVRRRWCGAPKDSAQAASRIWPRRGGRLVLLCAVPSNVPLPEVSEALVSSFKASTGHLRIGVLLEVILCASCWIRGGLSADNGMSFGALLLPVLPAAAVFQVVHAGRSVASSRLGAGLFQALEGAAGSPEVGALFGRG
ncbi:hypothetical protein Rleg10DRAFT_0398 [Rhizobium leguminosarum bv. trifolii WSM2012]|nr:hypothetical protein Rleg10DRAFT_0398 [Rhizobium leguminosarum bv. trifolii WSM2012]